MWPRAKTADVTITVKSAYETEHRGGPKEISPYSAGSRLVGPLPAPRSRGLLYRNARFTGIDRTPFVAKIPKYSKSSTFYKNSSCARDVAPFCLYAVLVPASYSKILLAVYIYRPRKTSGIIRPSTGPRNILPPIQVCSYREVRFDITAVYRGYGATGPRIPSEAKG